MTAQFEYQIGELRSAVWAISRHSGLWWRFAIAAGIVVGFLGFASLVTVAPPAGSSAQVPSESLFWQVLPWTGLFFVVWTFVFLLIRWGSIKKSHALLGRIWTLRIDADGVLLSDAMQKTEFSWRVFRRVVETKKLFLLFTDRKVALIVPKRIFDATSVDELRLLAKDHVGSSIRGFPVIPDAGQPASDKRGINNQ